MQDKFEDKNQENPLDGQLRMDDIKPLKGEKPVKVKLDALSEYMARKEREIASSENTPVVTKSEASKTKKNKEVSVNKESTVADSDDNGNKIIYRNLSEVMHSSMMPYTEHVILDRALPRVEDGLKPVQRRILYTMIQQGLEPSKPYKKSAKIVGDVLGKYHPHGDSSVYDAMVRMAQSYNLRMPLVDGHGNFGSIDGDSAAAYRYTEARLRPLALELVKDIDKETVKFALNFDDTLKEPETLPGKFPNLLVNGSMGIAVGLTTNIPPHNLAEVIDGTVAYIDNKNITLKELMKSIKAPDFPTGGYIEVTDELVKAYDTGKGKVTMRAKLHIENFGEKKNIVITQIPYQVNKAKLLLDIADLRERNKQGCLGFISDVVDESDRDGMRGVIKLKKDANVERIIAELYKKTNLQNNFNINMVAICNDRPEQIGLLKYMEYYVEYQREIVLKRSKFDLEQAKERVHILNGLIIAISNIDEAIKIIKKSENTTEAKVKLKERFSLSEKQAQAILDMRLARLTNLEIVKLKQEVADLNSLIKELSAIVASRKVQLEVVKTELLAVKRNYKDDRRSEIVKSFDKFEVPNEDEKEGVEVIVGVTVNGFIKQIPYKNYTMSQKEFNDKSSQNEVYKIIAQTKTDEKIYMFTNMGNCYKVNVSSIPEAKWKDKGNAVKNVIKGIDIDEKIIGVLTETEQKSVGNLVFFTKNGMVKQTAVSEYDLSKYTYQAIKLKEDDEVISASFNNTENNMLFVTKQGLILKAEMKDVPIQSRISGGVKGVNINNGDSLIYADICKTETVLIVTNFGNGKRVGLVDIDVLARYRKGVKVFNPAPREEIIFASLTTAETLVAMAGDNYETKDISSVPIESRTSKGKNIFKIKNGNAINEVWEYKK